MLIAVLHLLGTLGALVAILLLRGFVDGHLSRKRMERIIGSASTKLNAPREAVATDQYRTELSTYLAERYDENRIANRISDLGRPALIALEFIGYTVQLVIVTVAGWFALTDDPGHAPLAWLAVVAAIGFWLLNVVASGVLFLATGRSAGEARDARSLSAQLRNDDDRSSRELSQEQR